jgi:AcrR family transcriptional regulator
MPKATRSVEEVEDVREQIIDYALTILDNEGFENLSMSKLGSMNNMTAANIYNYFANKDELLIAIHKKTFEMLYDKINNAVTKAGSPLEKLKVLADSFVEFGTGNINIYDIMFNRPIRQYSDYLGTPHEAAASDEYHNSIKLLAYAVTIVSDFAETRPELHSADPKFLTVRVLSALHGIVSLNNSGILFEMDDHPETMLNAVIDSAIRSVSG